MADLNSVDPRPFLVGAEWRTSADMVDVLNPFDQSVVARVCLAGADDMDAAIHAASAAAEACAALPGYRRAEILRSVRESIRERSAEFTDGIVAQVGKPVRYARAEVDRALVTFGLAAEEATRIDGGVMPLDIAPGTERLIGVTRRFPVGVVGAITPFNFPLNLVAHKVAPAFAAGNAVVLKPAPQAPLTALLLGELFLAAGAPAGAVSVVPCVNAVAERLVRDSRVALLSFTGSAAAGWHLRSIAGKKRVVLELGGNAAVIVEDAADIDQVAQRVGDSAFAYAGQVCISTQRVFVRRDSFARFRDALVGVAERCAVGDPRDPSTTIGPLIDGAAAGRIAAWIAEATERGAHVLRGGPPSDRMMPATVLCDVPAGVCIQTEEAFAPVVLIEPYDTFDEALQRVNASRYGLQAGVFTDSLQKLMQAFGALQVGGIIANNVPSVRIDAMPYGGVKDSGIGREGVRSAIHDMTEERLLVIRA